MPIYLPLQVDFADDETVARLARYGKDARAIRDLLVQMWLYCKRNMTDGKVPIEQIGKLVYPDSPKIGLRDADRLVAVQIARRVEDGYYLPGYLKHNKSRAEIEEISKRKAEAGREGGKRSGQVRSVEANAKQDASSATNTETEHIDQSTKLNVENSLGGLRPVPLDPSEARCTAHQGVADPGNCRGCMTARLNIERKIEQSRRAVADERRECPHCDDDGFVLDADDGRPIARCDHLRRTG